MLEFARRLSGCQKRLNQCWRVDFEPFAQILVRFEALVKSHRPERPWGLPRIRRSNSLIHNSRLALFNGGSGKK